MGDEIEKRLLEQLQQAMHQARAASAEAQSYAALAAIAKRGAESAQLAVDSINELIRVTYNLQPGDSFDGRTGAITRKE